MKRTSKAQSPETAALAFARPALFIVWLSLAPGVPLQASEAQPHGHGGQRPGLSFTVSDFDGDNRPDLAQVHSDGTIANSTRYSIDFELSTGFRRSIVLTAPSGGLRLESRDVNGDHFPDVVVSTSWTAEPVAVLLNDGRGNFKNLDASVFPSAFETSDNSLDHAVNPEGDGTAAIFPRTPSGESKQVESTHAARDDLACVELRSEQFPSLRSRDCFSGRAPPAFFQ